MEQKTLASALTLGSRKAWSTTLGAHFFAFIAFSPSFSPSAKGELDTARKRKAVATATSRQTMLTGKDERSTESSNLELRGKDHKIGNRGG